MSKILVPTEVIENKIFLIRQQRVMIDRDIAELYGVETKNSCSSLQKRRRTNW